MNLVTARHSETIEPVQAQTVDVCVCSFRRPSISEKLESLASQALSPGWLMRVIAAAYCAVVALVRFCPPTAWRSSVVRGARHSGVSAALGRVPLQIY